MVKLSSTIKSYIAGFLDGDGCIMFQIVPRRDYRLGYEIRASIVFYQKTLYKKHLQWLQHVFEIGYIRDRGDEMTEYTVTGLKPVEEIMKVLLPYVRLKRNHCEVGLRICDLLKDRADLKRFVNAASLVDEFAELNYSKRRTHTSPEVITYLRQHKLYPRND